MDNLNPNVNNSNNIQNLSTGKSSVPSQVGKMEEGQHSIKPGTQDNLPSVQPQKTSSNQQLGSHQIQKVQSKQTESSKYTPEQIGKALLGHLEKSPSDYSQHANINKFINHPKIKELLKNPENTGLIKITQQLSSKIISNFTAHLGQISEGSTSPKEKLQQYKTLKENLNKMGDVIPKEATKELLLICRSLMIETKFKHVFSNPININQRNVDHLEEDIRLLELSVEISPRSLGENTKSFLFIEINNAKESLSNLKMKLKNTKQIKAPESPSIKETSQEKEESSSEITNKVEDNAEKFIHEISKTILTPIKEDHFSRGKKLDSFIENKINDRNILSDQDLKDIINSMPPLKNEKIEQSVEDQLENILKSNGPSKNENTQQKEIHVDQKSSNDVTQTTQPIPSEPPKDVKTTTLDFDRIKELINNKSKKAKLVFKNEEFTTKKRSFISRFIFRNKRIANSPNAQGDVLSLFQQLIKAAMQEANPLTSLKEAKELLESLDKKGSEGNFWLKKAIKNVPGLLKTALVDIDKAIKSIEESKEKDLEELKATPKDIEGKEVFKTAPNTLDEDLEELELAMKDTENELKNEEMSNKATNFLNEGVNVIINKLNDKKTSLEDKVTLYNLAIKNIDDDLDELSTSKETPTQVLMELKNVYKKLLGCTLAFEDDDEISDKSIASKLLSLNEKITKLEDENLEK